VSVRGGTANPLVVVNVRDLCTNNRPGDLVGVVTRRFQGAAPLGVVQSASILALDCTVPVRLTGLTVAKGRTYRVEVDANTATTPAKRRVLTIVGT
jgi:hypothetical protein